MALSEETITWRLEKQKSRPRPAWVWTFGLIARGYHSNWSDLGRSSSISSLAS
jgi:hypothetical protein